jgi:hypothetical protein
MHLPAGDLTAGSWLDSGGGQQQPPAWSQRTQHARQALADGSGRYERQREPGQVERLLVLELLHSLAPQPDALGQAVAGHGGGGEFDSAGQRIDAHDPGPRYRLAECAGHFRDPDADIEQHAVAIGEAFGQAVQDRDDEDGSPLAAHDGRPALGDQDLVSERTPVLAALLVQEGGGRRLAQAAADAVSEGPRPAAERLCEPGPGHQPASCRLQQAVVRQDPSGRIVHAERPLKAARQHRRHRAQHPDSVRQLPDGHPDLLRGLEHGHHPPN